MGWRLASGAVVKGTEDARWGGDEVWECNAIDAPPESRTDGSEGGGPSKAHLRDSYLDRMNDSILLGKEVVGIRKWKTNIRQTHCSGGK
jgi:hypothetical protein